MHAISEPVRLPRNIAIRLLALAQQDPDREVCGLIGADAQRMQVLPVRNVASDPSRAFEMDPEGLVSAHKALRDKQLALWGVYHSHPGTVAQPSTADLRGAGYPETVQLIVSLDVRGVLQLRAWRLEGDRARELPLQVHDG